MPRPLRALVTAGNTQTPIDRVRCVTNIFTGRTGARLALEAHDRGHEVTLLTSHPRVVEELRPGFAPADRWRVVPYRTFDELHVELIRLIPAGGFSAILHAAAVSDYALAGVYAPLAGAEFDAAECRWVGDGPHPHLDEVGRGKVKSSHPEVWLRMVPTPKLVDRMRSPWGFGGVLVKFKLEVDVTDEELLAVARRARAQSDADFLVANTLDGYESVAFLVDRADGVERLDRTELPRRLWERVEEVVFGERRGVSPPVK